MSCINCKPTNDNFQTVGKTYYLLSNKTVLCYRHWHQSNRPSYVLSGDYQSVMNFKKSQEIIFRTVKRSK